MELCRIGEGVGCLRLQLARGCYYMNSGVLLKVVLCRVVKGWVVAGCSKIVSLL